MIMVLRESPASIIIITIITITIIIISSSIISNVICSMIMVFRKSLASTSGSGRVFFPPGRSPPYSLTTPVWS